MTRVLFFLFVSLVPASGSPATWFVSTTGRDDNAGTAAKPLATITKASQLAKPGDVVIVRGGVYRGMVRIASRGTQSAPIVFRSENAIIDGARTPPNTNLVQLTEAEWVEFTGFEVRGATRIGISAWMSHHVTIAKNRVHDCGAAAIWAGGEKQGQTSDVTITGNTVTGNVLQNAAHQLSRGWPQAIGVYKSARVAVTHNVVSRNHGEGIAIIVSNHCTVADNEVNDNFSVEIYLDNAQSTSVERNFVYSSGDRRYFRGGHPAFGIGAANETYDVASPLEEITIANNIILRTRSAIFYGNYERGGGLRKSLIANNTCYASTEALVRIDESSRNEGTRVVNNIFYQSRQAPLARAATRGVTFSHNNWNRADRSRVAGEGDVIGDPLFVNRGGTSAADYRIAAGSRAIDAGVHVPDLPSDYFGVRRDERYDAGAVEFTKRAAASVATM